MYNHSDQTETIFQNLLAIYRNKTQIPADITKQSMDNQVIQRIASFETEPSILIWLFSQIYNHWIKPETGVVDESFCPPVSFQELIVERLLDMLVDIEHGKLTVVPVYNPNETLAEIPYIVSNGWTVTVYSRLYRWHRVDSFTTPDVIHFDPWLLTEEALHDRIFNYSPSDAVQRSVYGFEQVS